MIKRGPAGLLIVVVLVGGAVWMRARIMRCRPELPVVIDDPAQLDDLHLDLPDIETTKWVRTYLPEESSPGFNLILYRRRIPAVMDMNGSIVHAWPMVRAVGRARLSREGTLAVIGIDNLVKEYDWEGRLTWYFQLPDAHDLPHHDLITLNNGHYLILGHDGHTHTDYLFEVDRERRVVWEWWMHEHRRSFPAWNRKSTDPSHCNSIQELPPNRWFDAGDERFRPGNILVSARNLNTIFIIDKASGEVVWWYTKGLDHQHEARMIERGMAGAGRIILFNNGLEDLHAYRRSLVQVVDPVEEKVTWEYGSELFFSTVGGTAQPLPGGNTLITSSNGGRVFEITPEGGIVWEWTPPFNPMRLERLPGDHCPQLTALAPPDAEARRRRAAEPFVDTGLYRFDFPFDAEERVVAGKKRRLLRTNEGCRRLLIPPQASMKVSFGIDREGLARTSHQLSAAAGDAPHPVVLSHFGVLDVLSSTTPRPSDRKPHWARHLADLATKAGEKCGLGDRPMRARFTVTISGDGMPAVVVVDETLDSRDKKLWVRRTAPLGAYAYQHVQMCIATEIEEGPDELLDLAVWANPVVNSKSLRPPHLRPVHQITEQERRLREQQLKVLGYVN